MRFFPGWLRTVFLLPIAVAGYAAVTVAAAWGLDQVVHRGQVVRNVELEGQRIGGLGEDDLRRKVELVAARFADTPVEIEAPGLLLVSTASAAGVSVDVEATMDAAMEIGRERDLEERFRSWTRAFRDAHQAELRYSYDDEAARALIAGSPEAVGAAPVEPTFTVDGARLDVSPPIFGKRIDADDVVARLPAAVAVGHNPITVTVDWTPIPTEVSQAELDAAIDEARRMTSDPIWVAVDGRPAAIPGLTARRWLVALNTGGKIVPVFDEAKVAASLDAYTEGLISPGTAPQFSVVDNQVAVELGEPSLACCGPGVGELLWRAARGMIDQPVELPLELHVEGGAQAEADAYGIKELVGEFTTKHACCQSRVQNIHRIADLVRGVIIAPGERFSINEFIGQRTREKGFVGAGAIESGHFVEDVGGGISQFATTIFNAAFFAGLDFDEYQSHTIYISRYPYGREATLSWPKPDLVVVNNTPHHAMVWTSYTDTTITVQIWSTPYFTVEETGQRRGSLGACTRVETFRRRTAPDGQVFDDSVLATYRPGEGIDCSGRRIPNPRG